MVSARPAPCQALPAYKPGRNPADLAREIGVDRADQARQQRGRLPAAARRRPGAGRRGGGDQPLPRQRRRRPDPRRWPTATAWTPPRWSPAAARSRSARSSPRPSTTRAPSIAFAWRSFEMYPLLARVAGRAGDPGAARARAAPAARPTPTTSRRWPPRSTTPPGWSSSATRTTPPGRRCAGPSSSGSSTPSRRRRSSSSTRPTASSSPTPTSPTAWSSCAAGRTSPSCARSPRRGGWPASGSAT